MALEEMVVAFVDCVRRLEDAMERLELILAVWFGSGHYLDINRSSTHMENRLTPRRWRRSGPPRLANRARDIGVTLTGAAEVAAGTRPPFRRSFSRKARGVSQTFDRLSQKFGGKFDAARTAEVDLILFARGLSCVGSFVLSRLLFCKLCTDSCAELEEQGGIWG